MLTFLSSKQFIQKHNERFERGHVTFKLDTTSIADLVEAFYTYGRGSDHLSVTYSIRFEKNSGNIVFGRKRMLGRCEARFYFVFNMESLKMTLFSTILFRLR